MRLSFSKSTKRLNAVFGTAGKGPLLRSGFKSTCSSSGPKVSEAPLYFSDY